MGKRDRRVREEAPAEIPLARYLASTGTSLLTEKHVRDRAIRSLAVYVAQCTGEEGLRLEPLELAKLWKGIFYCFWMSDKPLVQQALAQELADLVLAVAGVTADEKRTKPDARALSAFDFYAGFWHTIAKEWLGIDKFRIDKYYMLMRRYVAVGLRLLKAYSWHPELVEHFQGILSGKGGPLVANDVHVPDSIAYHVSDVYLDELERVTSEDEKLPLIPLIMPFVELAAKSTSRAMHERVMNTVIEPLLEDFERIERVATSRKKQRVEVETRFNSIIGAMNDVDGDAKTKAGRVRHEILHTLFTVASGEDTYAPSRRRLYALWQAELDDDDE
ncbi:hypothetical protein MCUN1_003633 [Malassezia cuniculi]|uniref:Ribosomal RNA-processing protein 1 n=1 Tax=Malassezia cuniculi TaxID=948313 RepID=A0AAF0EYT4_9BASI|nr:hypothetical protein MCUN1_003633 [Malassezia cuniculi]